MKEGAEETSLTTVWKSLALFLEGSARLDWTIDVIESSDVRGGDLTKILEELRGHGNSGLHHAMSAVCFERGWIDSLVESSPPLVLIVEEHEDVAIIFANALQRTGFDTEIIRTGDAALTRLTETTPAVVILDLHLPRVSGVEILRRIRANAHLAGVYVIIATAYPDIAKGISEKANEIFLKPVSSIQSYDLALRLGFKYTGGISSTMSIASPPR
jgi:CheY-like chemotaxis protein